MLKPEKPNNQIQEILYCLITRINIERRQMMLAAECYNLPNQIMRLKNRYGIQIKLHKEYAFNKYGEKIILTKYSLLEAKEAREIYKKMLNNEVIPIPKKKHIPCTANHIQNL